MFSVDIDKFNKHFFKPDSVNAIFVSKHQLFFLGACYLYVQVTPIFLKFDFMSAKNWSDIIAPVLKCFAYSNVFSFYVRPTNILRLIPLLLIFLTQHLCY